MEKNKIINIVAGISGDIVSTSLANLAIPGATVLGVVLGPIVSAVTGDMAQRMLSQAENEKLTFVSKRIVQTIQQRIESGSIPRQDDFYVNDEYGQSSASKLLEEMLLNCKQEFEAKKLLFYSNFWTNICFENGISYEAANSIINQFSSLSYQQVKVLSALNNGCIIPVGKWEKYMYREQILEPYYTFYSDCLYLYNVRLASQEVTAEGGIKIGTPDICISPSGRLMCKLLEINFVEKEIKETTSYIQNIDSIVNRLMKEANDDGSDRSLSFITNKEIDAMFDEKKDAIVEEISPKWDVEEETLVVK